ncbi:DUF7534 family protein [Haloplanus halobius]|uniref:DUF7534 family protein n=1 Tax=Haloplanus halobius TaxID=2934938 RepID=UPI00200E8E83|nr:hypothetical protein [Haloplanus sp. XH21]
MSAGADAPPRWRRFAVVASVLVAVVVVVTAVRAPPDPVTQVFRLVPGVVVALILAYWIARSETE